MRLFLLTCLLVDFYRLTAQTTREPADERVRPQPKLNYLDSLDLQAIVLHNHLPQDSTVYQVFARNSPNWQKMLVVADWTGSMYPYGMQVLTWIKQNLPQKTKFKKFVFFNDGDNKKLGEKVIGATGGFYATDSQDFNQIIQVMLQAQKGGQGGDGSENDLEALLFGQQICKDCEDIILLADAESMVRDLLLLPQLAKQIKENHQKLHIILCGKINNALADYLQIAQATHASVHTLTDDLFDLQILDYEGVIRLYRRLIPPRKAIKKRTN